jgi:hypothetical protein
MAENTADSTILSFVDQNKYDADLVMRKIDGLPRFAERFAAVVDDAATQGLWPKELANWKLALLALVGNEIGGIASPMIRADASEILFGTAEREGFSRATVTMAAGQVSKLRDKLTDLTLICG